HPVLPAGVVHHFGAVGTMDDGRWTMDGGRWPGSRGRRIFEQAIRFTSPVGRSLRPRPLAKRQKRSGSDPKSAGWPRRTSGVVRTSTVAGTEIPPYTDRNDNCCILLG